MRALANSIGEDIASLIEIVAGIQQVRDALLVIDPQLDFAKSCARPRTPGSLSLHRTSGRAFSLPVPCRDRVEA